jgi:Electron transfer DM13
MSTPSSVFNRHRVVFGIFIALLLVAAAIPLTAYVIVPQFVRSKVVEKAPGAPSSVSATPAGLEQGTAASPAADTSKTVAAGDLKRINPVDFGTGKVLVLQVGAARFLRFENVEIAAAPAQHVYLSDHADGTPGTFTDLGPLKATSGSFNYEIPASVDLTSVKSVVSWCLQFKTTVTYAVLQAA